MSAVACSRCRSLVEREDLRCAVCGQASPAVLVEDAPETVVDVLRCRGCGAAVAYDVKAQAPACAFCGGRVELERPVDPPEQVELELPFTVERGRAEAAYRGWLGGLGFFRPSDLLRRAEVESLRPLWWVGWAFDATALVSWTADSDSGARRADWAPHAGQTELGFDDIVVPATRGLTHAETARLAPTYRLETARPPGDDGGPDGAVRERFDVPRSVGRRQVLRAIDRLAEHRLRSGVIPGRRFRKVHTAALLRGLATRRLAFPAWVVAYRYRGRPYRTVISGQDATCIQGTAPVSVARIVAVAAAVAVGALALLALAALLGS